MYKMPGARSPPSYLPTQEYHAYTHHHHHHHPLSPIEHAHPSTQVQTCLQFLCNLFGSHPHSQSLLPAPPLPRPFTLSFLLPSPSRARSGCRQRGERLAAGSGSPGARCRAAGSRAALVTEYNKPGRLLAGGRSAAASPGRARTPSYSCAQLLRRSPLPLQSGPPPGCTLGF